MVFFWFSDPVVASVKLNVLGGKIQVKKVDSETNSTTPQGAATLVGAKYNVINSNGNVVSTLTIGEDMTAITDNLPLGTYTIKEVSAPTGYELDKTTYTVTVNSSDTVNITVKDKVIKGKIKVVKLVCESNSVATKKGNKDGTIEFAHKTSPLLAADKLLLENITRHPVNIISIDGNISCLIFIIYTEFFFIGHTSVKHMHKGF